MIENSIFDEMMLSMKLKSGSAMFISENIILDYNCGFDGDVKAHLKKLCRRFLIPFIILFNLVPVTLYFAFFVSLIIKITFNIIRWNTTIKTDEYKDKLSRKRRIREIRLKNIKKIEKYHTNELINFYYGK